MRIINILLFLFLVFSSFNSSYQMAIVKGLGSFPESVQDCSRGETTQTPEATDVRHPMKPKTDSLNDVAKPQLPEDLKGPTSLSPITPKMKRCARHDTVGSRHNTATLSLARRDVSAWRNRQCEICRSGSLCKKLDKCSHCSSICNNISTTPASVDDVDNNVNPITPEAQKREATVDDQQDMVLGSRFRGTEEDINRPRYYSLGSVEPGALMRLFVKIFNIPENFEKLIVLGKMKEADDNKDADDIVIIDLAQVFRNEKKIIARVQKVDNNGAEINMDLIEKLDKDLEKAIKNKLEENGNPQLSKDEIGGVVDEAIKEGNDNVGSSLKQTTTAPKTETRCNLDESMEDLLHIKPKKEHKNENPYPEYKHENPYPEYKHENPYPEHKHENPYPEYKHEQHYPEHKHENAYPEHKPEPLKPHVVFHQPESSEESSEEEISNPPVIQDNYVVGEKKLENEYVDDNGEINPISNPDVVGKKIDDGYVDDNEEARPSVISEFKIPKSKPTLQEANKPEIPKETQILGEHSKAEFMSVPEETKSIPPSRNQINEPNLQGRAHENVELPSQNLQDSVAKIVEDSLKLVPEEGSVLQNPVNNLVEKGTLQEKEPLINEPNLQERGHENVELPSQNLQDSVAKIVEDSLKLVPEEGSVLQNPVNNLVEEGTLQEKEPLINEPNLQERGHEDVELPSQNLQDSVAKIVKDSLKLVPEDGSVLQNPVNNLVEEGTPQEKEPPINDLNHQERNNEPKIGNPLQDLEKNIVAIVEDSLKVVPNGQNTGQESESDNQVSEPNPHWRTNADLIPESQHKIPSEDLTKNVFTVVNNLEKTEGNFVGEETPQEIQQDTKQPSQANADNTVREIDAPPVVTAEIANRVQKVDSGSSEESSSFFGALVPAKNAPPNLDPRIKNIFYVGEDINLPLKMVQDENGVIKLHVDTEALCNCKNKNCTKKHVDDEFKSKPRESEIEETGTALPELQVRFGSESHHNEDLLNSFDNDLHRNDGISGIFKRSPEASFDDVVDDNENDEELELENEIRKLDENIETYYKANEDLLNKGTMALYKDVQKSKSVGKMITLASNLLSWMKQVASDRRKG